ncbi:MAG: HAD domain-containing protein [Fluviicola sp.]|jgi:hypothetical protein
MLIYLDIDGVMVSADSWKRPEILVDGFMDFKPKAVCALNRIIADTSAKIVLTTSHKHLYSLTEWKKIFEKRNIQVSEITRLPENKNHSSRKQELLDWFNVNGITEDFIIIDDDKSLNELPEFLKCKLIQTYGSIGLTDSLAEEAINKLRNSQKDFV